jgi:integrase
MAKSQNRLKFTQGNIEKLPPAPRGKQIYYYDTKTPGFALRVTPEGVKTFCLYRWHKDGPERATIGRFSDLKVEEARKKLEKMTGKLADGKRPSKERSADREAIKFGDLFEEFLERHAKPHKKTWRQDVYQYDRHLAHWRNKKAKSISKLDITKLHSALKDNSGLYTANRALELIRVVLNKGIDWGLLLGPSPAIGIKHFREKTRDRFLQADELPRFFQALAEEPNETFRDFVLICLLTGARRGNVQAMRWDEIDLERAIWRIPETKSGDSHLVPLVPSAVEILEARQQDSDNEWVFPGPGKTGHLVEIKSAWSRVLKRAEIKDLRLHDLRRTLGSWQAAQGASLAIIGKSLAHKNVSTTLIYSRLNIDPVRASVTAATDAILTAGGVKPQADIEDLPKKAQRGKK